MRLVTYLILSASVAFSIFCGDLNCYEVLNVPNNATPTEIKRSFRKLSLKYHPDKNRAKDAQERFQEIATAYEILSNPEDREDYDYIQKHPDAYMSYARYGRYQMRRFTH